MLRGLKRKYISVMFEERGNNPFIKILSRSILTFSLPKQIIKECDYGTEGPNKGTRDMAEALKVYFISIFMCLIINFKLSGRFGGTVE